jgi:spore coat polysaccharide biosynthesis protein SpsF (cytidylyltransferase family)
MNREPFSSNWRLIERQLQKAYAMAKKVTAIIQARMTSTRLPGKVLIQVMGRPLLSYQIERLRFSKKIDRIIIATTTNKEDDQVVELVNRKRVKYYRGDEYDVLDRYYQAAKEYEVEHIMRLTADCPLIQPDICDRMASTYFQGGFDYLRTGPTFAQGLDCEILSLISLEKAWKNARLKSEREHVTLYIRNHPELFATKTVENGTDDSKYRITVDHEEDYLVVKAIIENLYGDNCKYLNIEDIKSFLESHPAIFVLNRNIARNEGLLKSLEEDALVDTS